MKLLLIDSRITLRIGFEFSLVRSFFFVCFKLKKCLSVMST